jgi:hypothetical protein
MENLLQDNFAGGMSLVFDSTKTPANMFRCGLNTQIRKNSLVGFFRPIRIPTPSANHQAIFTLDVNLCLVIAGNVYRFDDVNDSVVAIPSTANLDADAEYVYTANVPVPTNTIVNSGYRPSISAFTPATVLQDGLSQPLLVGPNMAARQAYTYDQWTFDNPEYIPIGKQMAVSGNKLFVVSPDGTKVFQSVSGRCVDFVLNFNSNTGERQGDAASTSLAFSAAKATAIVPSQNGGFLGFTRYGAHAGQPRPDYPLIFGEVYIDPVDLFPVGAVNHLAFTLANGESVFVSPTGIQSFNQVAQIQSESNATIFGAPISDLIIKPIVRTACISAAEYSFFAFDTIYGSAIAVFDNRISAWAGLIIGYSVKQFAVLNTTGLERLFFITHTDEFYELPLYSGSRMPITAYLGEYTSGPNEAFKPTRASVFLNNIRGSGNLQVAFYLNRKQVAEKTLAVTAEREAESSLETVPVDFPTEGETQAEAFHFEPDGVGVGQNVGLRVSFDGDAAVTGVNLELTRHTRMSKEAASTVASDLFMFIGNIAEDNTYTANAQSVVVGSQYVFYTPDGASRLLNGGEVVTTYSAHEAKVFTAKADRIYFSAGMVLDFSSVRSLLDGSYRPIVLGNLGTTARCAPILATFNSLGKSPLFTFGPHEHDNAERLVYAYGYTGYPEFYKHETDNLRIYLATFPIDTADGVGPYSPLDDRISGDGKWAKEIENNNLADEKFCVFCCHQSPFADTAYPDLRWNYRRLGVRIVVSGDGEYYRTYQDGVVYVRAGGIAGRLLMKGYSHGADFIYETLEGVVHDRFYVPR